MTKILKKPIPPADDDCCGGGACNPCVWDNYNAQLQKWRIEQAKLKEQEAKSNKNNFEEIAHTAKNKGSL